MRPNTMWGSVRPRKSNVSIGPVVPYTSLSACPMAIRPAPRAVTSVPSMSNRKSCTRAAAPQRAALEGETSQAIDNARHDVDHVVDLGGGRPPAQREAQRALGGVTIAADGAQDVRRLTRERGTGRARRRSDAAQVELEQDAIGFDAGDDETHVVRQALRADHPRDARPAHALEQLGQEAIAKRGEPRRFRLQLGPRQLRGHAHADDGRQVLRTGSEAPLLATSEDDGRELLLRPHPERS